MGLTLVRGIGLAMAALAIVYAFGDRPPVPFRVVLLAILPACLVGILLFRSSLTARIQRERSTIEQAHERFEEIERINRELSRELSESRIIEETQLLQVKAFDAFLQGVTITDPNRPGNPIVYANEGFQQLTGYTRNEVVGKNCRFLQGKETCPETMQVLRDAIRQRKPILVDIQNYRKDGTPFWNALSLAPIFEEGRLTHFVGVQTDITPFKIMELQLRQSQKMEAIGHLAGGIAHDFNNLLTVINGCCELLKLTTKQPADALPLLDEVHKAGDRAATLTRQLLAFSRKTVVQTRVASLTELVKEFESLLVRVIGEDISLVTEFNAPAGRVRVDPGQIEQILLNLAVNGRDAMPKGGRLTIATRDVYIDDEHARQHADLEPGRYVLLAVTDTGCGMDRATLDRIFEPFFTTKPVGQGTGMGLAMVYGVVKAPGGYAQVESEINRGTTFRLYFPAIDEMVPAPIPPSRDTRLAGSETVLLVEDEDGVRTLARQALEAGGYRVLEASDGEVALRLCHQHRGKIDLLLSDVVMPRMGGRDLRCQIELLSPRTRVIFTSGYTDDAVVRNGVYQAESDFLQKPFSITALLRKVREVLDRGHSANDLAGSKA